MVNRNGAFPTYQIKSDTLRFDGALPLYLPNPPSVSAALATEYNKVRVYYSTEMKHSDPEASDDSLNPDNYEFSEEHSPIFALSVALTQASPTIVEVTLTAEMTLGESYTVTVSNVLSISEEPLGASIAAFTGFGISPRVASTEVMQPRCTRIHFDEAMKHDAALELESNYALTGPTSPTVDLISIGEILGITYADVFFTGAVTHGGSYHIEISNVKDLAENVINPSYDTGDFTGFNPEVSGAVAQANGLTVRVTFNSEVKHSNPLLTDDSLNPSNYLVEGPLGTQAVVSVSLNQADPTIVDLLLATEMHDGGEYTVTVSNVHTIGGYDLYVTEAEFTGVGIAPQVDTAEAIEPRKIRVMFDDLMKHDVALETPGNYGITGPTSPTATEVTPHDAGGVTYCDVVFTGAVTHGELYQVEVSGVLDAAENPIDTGHDTGSFTGMNPEVASAEAQADHRVRVTFNMAMKHASAENPDDALNPANYELTWPILETNVTSVDLVQASPTVVDLNLDAEMTEGGEYTVTVSDVETSGSFPLYVDEADFEGIGTAPWLDSADCTAFDTVVVWFDELMVHNANLIDPENYTFEGPTALTTEEVMAEDVSGQTKCTLTVSGFMHDDNYQVNVVEVIDLAGNPIDEDHDTQDFLGICPGPRVSISKPNLHTAVYIQFDRPVLNALDHTHYTFDPDPVVVEVEEDPGVENGYIVVISVDEEGVDYTMFVSADVTSLTGFPMNPLHDSVDFTGKANEPPVALLTNPPPGYEDWRLDQSIKVRAYDPQYLIGIDETTWDITLTRPLLEGGTETLTPVVAGVLQAGFVGSKSGDPLRPVGVTWTLLPNLLWAQASTYTVESYVEDAEGMPNVETNLGTFETVVVDAENVEWEETDLDRRLWTPLADPNLKNCEILRGYLLPICTYSPKKIIRSRTLLYWASRCPNRAAAPLVDDFRVIADLKFRLRPTTDEFFVVANDFLPHAPRAVDELRGIDDETKADLKALLTDPLPVNIVSTMASIVILAVFETLY